MLGFLIGIGVVALILIIIWWFSKKRSAIRLGILFASIHLLFTLLVAFTELSNPNADSAGWGWLLCMAVDLPLYPIFLIMKNISPGLLFPVFGSLLYFFIGWGIGKLLTILREGRMKKLMVCVSFFAVLFCWSPAVFADEIHEAAKSGDLAKIKVLLDKNPKLLLVQDDVGKTPLHWAVGRGQTKAVKLLLDIYKADPNIRNKNGGTPLHVAASQAQPEAARLLIAAGADVNARTRNDSTPLHFAAFKGQKSGHIEAAKVLIENGADVNAKIDTGATPLSMAMYRQNSEIIALLKKHGAKPGSGQRGMRQGGGRQGSGSQGSGNYYLDDY